MRLTNLSTTSVRVLAYVLVTIPVICFTALLLTYVVNVPWIDDIDAFLSFIIGYLDAPTLAEKFDWLIRPNNEHRILTGKLITLALYNLTGVVNYRWLIFAAFAFLIGLLYLFYRVFRSTKLPLLAFVPVPFLLLQPQFYLTSMWAITGLQHQVVVMLAFLTLYLLASNTRTQFLGALVVQCLASLSMSNGLFGWVAGAVVLALQRQWLRLGSWLAIGITAIVFYFHDFSSGQGNESSVTFFFEHPHLVFFGFFTFTGGLFDFVSKAPILWRSILPTLAGFVLIPTMLWLLWRMNEPLLKRSARSRSAPDRTTEALWKRRYFFTGCYAFLMVNAVIVAFLRPRFGYQVMLISNYMLYPAVLVILLYLNILSERQNCPDADRWVWLGLALGALVWSNWYLVNLPQIAYRQQQLLTCTFNQKYTETGLGPSWGSDFMRLVQRTMGEATRRGIYHYPDAYFAPYEAQLLASRSIRPDTTLRIDVVGGGYSVIAQTAYNALPNPVSQAAILIQSAQRTYLFPSESPFRFATFYLDRPVRTVQGEIVIGTVAPGRYRLGILAPSGRGNAIRFSPQSLTIPE